MDGLSWTIAICTALSAIANVGLAVLTYFYVRLTHELATVSKQSREPFVDLELIHTTSGIYVGVVNAGGTSARSIRLSIIQDTDGIQSHGTGIGPGLSHLRVFQDGISYLPAGQRFRYIGGALNIEKCVSPVLIVQIRFQGDKDLDFVRRVTYDVRQFDPILFKSQSDPLETIASELRNLSGVVGRSGGNSFTLR